MQEKETNEEDNMILEDSVDVDSRIYEVGYLLSPNIKEEDVPVLYGNLKELIFSLGGQIISDEMPIMINLAYTMQKIVQNVHNKYDTAYFGWVKFLMEGEKVLELKKKLDLDVNVVRFLILKTVKENTIASKRFVKGVTRRKAPSLTKGEETKEEIIVNKEEIDKEIDAMVAN